MLEGLCRVFYVFSSALIARVSWGERLGLFGGRRNPSVEGPGSICGSVIVLFCGFSSDERCFRRGPYDQESTTVDLFVRVSCVLELHMTLSA